MSAVSGNGRLSVRVMTALAAVVLSAAAACGGDKVVQAPTPVIDPPTIACPAPVPQVSATGQAVAVTYQPTTTAGAEPVTTACTPASGSTFTIGSTPVTCTATDARQRTASCTFNVVIQAPPRISMTRFVAFGDSITWGEDGLATLTMSPADLLSWNYPTARLLGREYPTVLQQLLTARYTTQTFSVFNDGFPGEKAANAVSRFTDSMIRNAPQVALLLEGTNDIYGGTGGNPPGIAPAIAALRQMIVSARGRGIRVLLATVPPQNPAGPRGALGYQTVPLLNAEIRLLASSEGVPLVDVFDAFNGNLALLGPDGLHPNANGYVTIANKFYDVIRAQFETSTTLTGGVEAVGGFSRVTAP